MRLSKVLMKLKKKVALLGSESMVLHSYKKEQKEEKMEKRKKKRRRKA